MGRKEMTRRVTETIIKSAEIIVEDVKAGKVTMSPLADIKVRGKIDNEGKALDLVKKAYGKKQFAIIEMSQTETLYALSVDDFMKYAHKVEEGK
jgi:hypothetical protein